MTLSGIVLIAAPHWIVGLYLHLDDPANKATVTLASSLLGVAAIFQIVDGMQTVGSGCLRGLKDTRVPMIAATFGTGSSAFQPVTCWHFTSGWARGFVVGTRGRPRERCAADDTALSQT
jgi:Na+-driven multidrug efflux pump